MKSSTLKEGIYTFYKVGLVATLCSNLWCTWNGLPYCEFPKVMMSDLIIATETNRIVSAVTWICTYTAWTLYNVVCLNYADTWWKTCYCAMQITGGFAVYAILVWDIDSYPETHRIFGGVWGLSVLFANMLEAYFATTFDWRYWMQVSFAFI